MGTAALRPSWVSAVRLLSVLDQSVGASVDSAKNVETQSQWLRPRLFTPTAILSLVLLGLTVLPMASCGASNSKTLVPAELAVQLTIESADKSSASWPANYVVGFIQAVPLVFLFTLPYWTGIPAIGAVVFWRWRSLATAVWRLLILMLALAVASYVLFSDDASESAIGVIGVVAITGWLWSSPLAAWLVGLAYRVAHRGKSPGWAKRKPVRGGYQTMSVLCLSAYFYLMFMRDDLLYGGKLAAIANALLGFTFVLSTRQWDPSRDRLPQFSTRDLMILTTMIAASMWWFWGPTAVD